MHSTAISIKPRTNHLHAYIYCISATPLGNASTYRHGLRQVFHTHWRHPNRGTGGCWRGPLLGSAASCSRWQESEYPGWCCCTLPGPSADLQSRTPYGSELKMCTRHVHRTLLLAPGSTPRHKSGAPQFGFSVKVPPKTLALSELLQQIIKGYNTHKVELLVVLTRCCAEPIDPWCFVVGEHPWKNNTN